MSYWILTGNYSANGKGCKTLRVGVAAKTIMDAHQVALKKYPEFVVMAIQHQGPIEVQQT